MSSEGRFNVAVGAIIEHTPSGEILILKRTNKKDFSAGEWEYITGRMKQFEEPEEAVRREVMEESGLPVEIVKPVCIFHIFRGEKTAENELVGITYWCKTKTKEVTISDEHSDYKWVAPDDVSKTISHSGILRDIQAFINEKGN
jgi:8-oxo-dGTP pyrophosphatase MutT (NUDIX family)